MAIFVKLDKDWWKGDENMQKNDCTICNIKGIKKEHIDLSNIKTVFANSFCDLDWNNTSILNNTSIFGWLDRKGNFYGCGFAEHELQARLIHKTEMKELEKLGWIHISKFYRDIMAFYSADYKNGIVPTFEQLKYLAEHKYVVSDYVMEAYNEGNHAKAKLYEQKLKEKESKEFTK